MQYLKNLSQETIPQEEQIVLIDKFRSTGEVQYRNKVIEAMVKLIIDIIGKDFYYSTTAFEDLLQEGVLAVVEAIDRFDKTKSDNFSSYAVIWIKGRIKKYLANNSKQLSTKPHVIFKAAAIKRERVKFQQKHGRDPSVRELSLLSGVSPKTLHLYEAQGGEELRLDGDNAPKKEFLRPDDQENRPYIESFEREGNHLLQEALELLPEKEREVLEYRFGLNGKSKKTLKELEMICGCSYEWCRILERKALEKMKKLLRKEDVI
jgi:RNA polymerase sigma factor (sigma-70 family)